MLVCQPGLHQMTSAGAVRLQAVAEGTAMSVAFAVASGLMALLAFTGSGLLDMATLVNKTRITKLSC